MWENQMSEGTTAIGVASQYEVRLAKYRECLEKLLDAATEPKHFADSVDAPPEQGKDVLGWAAAGTELPLHRIA